MAGLVVPSLETSPYPTLGPQVAAFMERYQVHGPGDIRGMPYRLTPEKRALLYRMYEVQPPDHPQAGRRRFRRVGISLRKGLAKTEFAAEIVVPELHPDGPVRCIGWERVHGAPEPVGGGVVDPYIVLIATTEEQSDELCFGALKAILENSPLRDDFDIGLERIMRRGGDGKAVALAGAPDARDGARTTFSVFDETHRWTSKRQHQAHQTMLANLPKRRAADPWALEITTAPAPGEGSVAEKTMEYAKSVAAGDREDARLFFFHRQAAADNDFSTPELVRAGILEASGADAEWSDIDGVCEMFADPTADVPYLRRVWGNQLVQSSGQAFDAQKWRDLARPEYRVPDGALIVLGFDGSRYIDSTVLHGMEVKTGHLFVLGAWEHPPTPEPWEVPIDEVELAVKEAFTRYDVWRGYFDPSYWETFVAKWAGEHGEKVVIRWSTRADRRVCDALRAFANAIVAGEITHDGNEMVARHIGNAHKRVLPLKDAEGKNLWVIQKEREGSPNKIDGAYSGMLANEARRDAITSGAASAGPSVWEDEDYEMPVL